jgi:hypothetical protein
MSRSHRRAKKRAHLIAYAMWGVLGSLLIVLGIMMGLAYVDESGGGGSGAVDVLAKTRATDVEPEPAAKPKPAAPAPEKRPVPEQPTPARPNPEEPNPEEPNPAKPRPEVTTPQTLEDAGGSVAGQQAMLDRARAVTARSDKMGQEGTFTDQEREEVAAFTQSGRTILANWEAACEQKRWDDVVRFTRDKNINSNDHEKCLDRVALRVVVAHRMASEAAKRKEAARKAALPPPAVQMVHDLLADATKERDAARAAKSRAGARHALEKTLEKAWSLTSRLKGSDRSHQASLRLFIHNSRGECQEVLAELAKHRRPQEVMKIRALTQRHAVKAYERTLKMGGDAVYATGLSARAWALHRIAVLSARIARHHQETLDAYRKRRRTYPMANLIGRFKIKSHEAITRLKTDYPKATNPSGTPLWKITE